MSYPKSGVLELAVGDTTGEVVGLSPGQRFRINDILIQYGGSTACQVEILDGDGGEVVERAVLEAGEDFSAEDLMRSEVEDSVNVSTNGNEDSVMFITVGGEVTSG